MKKRPNPLDSFSTAIVTGGSSGIGESLLKLVSRLKGIRLICNLSRRPPRISLPVALRHKTCDLADAAALAEAADELCRDLAEAPPGKLLLVHNSGVGGYGRFPGGGVEEQMRLIDVNVRAVVDLTSRLMVPLQARGGAILLVASTAAWQPTPWLATYGAAKGFVLNWGLALREDLKASGIGVTVLCPGPTRTDFFTTAGMGEAPPGMGMSDPDEVARLALCGIERNRAIVMPGFTNRVLAATGCRLPRRWQGPVADFILKRFRNPASNAE